MRATKWLRGLRVAGATVSTLCVTWSCTSCSAAASRRILVACCGVGETGRATVGQHAAARIGDWPRLSVRSGRTLFVTGQVRNHFETVAYRAATGARLWATAYQPAGYSIPRAITVSPDGATVYVTGGDATLAYDAGTGKQLWASQHKGDLWALAVSPDSTTLYVTGSARGAGSHQGFATIAYAAGSSGKQRWLRYYTTAKFGLAESVAVSPDGKMVYVTGSDGSALTVAYQAAGP